MKEPPYESRWLPLTLVALLAWASSFAHAQDADSTVLRYEPPSVDYVYPEEGEILAPVAPTSQQPTDVQPTEPASKTEPSATEADPPESAESLEPPPSYGAEARVRTRPTPGSREVSLQSARDLPGAFGDPLRILDSLPGTSPIANAVPYVYLRGAPPAAISYVYDDIPLPQLFHAVFGRSVIHPRTVGPIKLHAGIPPARYGRRAGGLVLAQGLPQRDSFSAELELSLIDASAWIEGPVGKGTVTFSGHVGYPSGAIAVARTLGLVKEGTSLTYYDGQLRYRVPVGAKSRFELVWLGSTNTANLPGLSNNPRAGASSLHFQRVEPRFVHQVSRGEVGAALRFGYDDASLGDALQARATTFGPRIWSQLQFGAHSVRFGGDLYATVGNVYDGPGTLSTPQGELLISLPLYSQAPGRNQGGIFAQTSLQMSPRTQLELGGRFDYWSTNGQVELAFDPRTRFILNATEKLQLHAAFGMGHQPAVFMLPLPVLSDIAVSKGLTRSYQAEVGVGYDLPYDTRLEVQAFYHHYDGLLLPELLIDGYVPENPPLVSAHAYGLEMFLKRDLNASVTGWVSYTLSYAEADSGDLIGKFKPDFDVRHVLNTVLQWRVWKRWEIGGRFSARSGRIIEQLNPSYAQRLPWFVRTDMRLGYRWQGHFAKMLVYFEWLNMWVRPEYLDADCLLGTCRVATAPVISIPNLGVRAEF